MSNEVIDIHLPLRCCGPELSLQPALAFAPWVVKNVNMSSDKNLHLYRLYGTDIIHQLAQIMGKPEEE